MDRQVANPESQGVGVEGSGSTTNTSRTSPLPKLQLSVLLYMSIAERVNARVIHPFIVQMVIETGITDGDVTKVGYYTGLVESVTYLAEGLLVLRWGRLSDQIGRRPVLFMGLFGMCFSMFCFGLSHSFWAIVFSRAIYGAMNSSKGSIKTIVGELTDKTNITRGFALLPPAWSIAGTISPLIGGMLQHPYERFRGIFRHSDFWKIHPYFLPCFATVLLTLSAITIGFLFFDETAPGITRRTSTGNKRSAYYTQTIDDIDEPGSLTTVTERSPLVPAPASSRAPPSVRVLLTRRVFIVIFNWAIFGCVDVSFEVLQPLIYSSPIANGGLGMSPSVVGACLAGFGIFKGIPPFFLFPWLFRTVGSRQLNTICVASLLGSFILFPIMNALARIEGEITFIVWAAYLLQLMLAALPSMAYNCLYIYLNSAALPSALGATNGLGQSVIAITRCFGPASATALYALSIRHNLLGGNLIYVVMCSLVVAAIMASRLLPSKPWDKVEG